MKIQKVSLIGLGAIGSFFAPKLYQYLGKENFRVIAAGERKKRLETRGVIINQVSYHFTVVDPQEPVDPADLVIISVKNMGLKQAIEDIRGHIGEHTQILCVINGVDSEEQVAAVYGWNHVLYSYVRVSIEMKDGAADYDPTKGKIYFGEADNHVLSTRVQDIIQLFKACDIHYQIEQDMIKGLWFKFMCNVAENLTCALLTIPYGAFRVSEHANAIRRAAMQEVVNVAKARGIHLGQKDIDRQNQLIQKLPFENKPSTLQDIESGRPTEVEMFAGKMLQLGKELGVSTPLNWLFYHGIKTLEEKNRGDFIPPAKV